MSISLISTAYAATSSQAGSPAASGLSSIALLLALLVIFYFLILRPQNKRIKEQQILINGLQEGDEVITTGGLVGRITKVGDQFVVLSLADKIEVTLQKQAISATLPRGTMASL